MDWQSRLPDRCKLNIIDEVTTQFDGSRTIFGARRNNNKCNRCFRFEKAGCSNRCRLISGRKLDHLFAKSNPFFSDHLRPPFTDCLWTHIEKVDAATSYEFRQLLISRSCLSAEAGCKLESDLRTGICHSPLLPKRRQTSM